MAHTKRSRHYRAVQRAHEEQVPKGVFIGNQFKNKFIAVTAICVLVVFMNGILVGRLFSKVNQ